LLRQFIDETQEIEVSRVEKTLNTSAKPLDEPVKNEVNSSMQAQSMQAQTQSMPQMQPMPQTQPMPQMQPMQPEPLNDFVDDEESFQEINNLPNINMNMPNMNQNMNMNQNINQNVFEPRRPSITFNPEPSILEFDNIESEIKIEPNDSVFDLEFEEL
jgi:hypothetical protein